MSKSNFHVICRDVGINHMMTCGKIGEGWGAKPNKLTCTHGGVLMGFFSLQ